MIAIVPEIGLSVRGDNKNAGRVELLSTHPWKFDVKYPGKSRKGGRILSSKDRRLGAVLPTLRMPCL